MQKPPPITLTYYRSPAFEDYVRAARPRAVWLLERLDWNGDHGQLNLDKLAADAAKYPGAYPTGAPSDIDWLKTEFSWLIWLRR